MTFQQYYLRVLRIVLGMYPNANVPIPKDEVRKYYIHQVPVIECAKDWDCFCHAH